MRFSLESAAFLAPMDLTPPFVSEKTAMKKRPLVPMKANLLRIMFGQLQPYIYLYCKRMTTYLVQMANSNGSRRGARHGFGQFCERENVCVGRWMALGGVRWEALGRWGTYCTGYNTNIGKYNSYHDWFNLIGKL